MDIKILSELKKRLLKEADTVTESGAWGKLSPQEQEIERLNGDRIVLIDTIEKLSEQTRWIPMTERTPKESDWAKYTNYGDYAIWVLRNGYEPDLLSTRQKETWGHDDFEDCGYTHWMHVAELPKEIS